MGGRGREVHRRGQAKEPLPLDPGKLRLVSLRLQDQGFPRR